MASISDPIFLKNRSKWGEGVKGTPSFFYFHVFSPLGGTPRPRFGRFWVDFWFIWTPISPYFGTNKRTRNCYNKPASPNERANEHKGERTHERTSQPERTCERTQQANEPTNEPANPNERAIHSNSARNTASSANRLADGLVGSREANRIN